MVNRKILLGLLFLLVANKFIECRRSFGRSRSSSRGGWSSHKSSKGSHSYSKPWWSKLFSSSHSSSGHGHSSSSSSHSYPSSSSGLSGSGYSYPSGLSGGGSSYPSGSGKISYPSSISGLSGFGSGKSTYPSSSSGLSGSGKSGDTSSTYGIGTNNKYSPSSGVSEFGSRKNHYTPSSTGQSHHHGYYTPQITPTYYSAPQYVYITEYKNSGSRYRDLLTGLTLYNLGRSHSHYHNHHYYDDYYNRRYSTNSNNNNYNSNTKPQETAACRLQIKDHDAVETLKIPCEIVSTFTEDKKKVLSEHTVNTTVCVTKSTFSNSTTPSVDQNRNATIFTNGTSKVPKNVTQSTEETLLVKPLHINHSELSNSSSTTERIDHLFFNVSTPVNSAVVVGNQAVSNSVSVVNTTTETPVISKAAVVDVTTCTTTTVNTTDPLVAKGPTVDPSGKQCIVEIQTKDSLFRNNIDCSTLMKYSRMPEPRKEESNLMPSRDKLKSWISNPPWWLSTFIAV